MELNDVLIVDDSEADQYLNRYRLLERQPSVTIRSAFDGVEALNVLREVGYKPDLILLDINMPRMNGFEFLEIYVDEFNGATSSVVVMLTSSLLESDRQRAESFKPVRGFLLKPLDASWPERLLALDDDQ
ncbi:MAG: CheY-like chemotaxis protein [Cognaticolwellia sp.]|jgi:CheY-like chemotaxis protein